ncbi:TIGR03364 family FAD-dependent oxidoreductase [Usitatibacter palustris]|uniref:D-amino acid dehydrogenase n=1 Tax=Usitatibacter palustris TaxID=2732487 RepID=A0A6M4H460_9PROT|nr:TIGR03364 family FAD-dependent oxidoreductase [Usitatibacter palustris]QJR14381.1 D-amino acid dehydrogenase [Usitatibacter palustris]
MARYDLAVAGAGIVGLAHALAAARRGLRVAVVERDARASRSSIQNFGFVTVSGQGASQARAQRSRDAWLEVAGPAGINVEQRGALIVARRAEALAVLEEFAASAAGAGCELLDPARLRSHPMVVAKAAAALWSPHEVRIEAREALPRLAAWLAAHHKVDFHWSSPVTAVDERGLHHANGCVEADAIVLTVGADVATLFPDRAREAQVRHCMLQMMRVAAPSWRLPGVVMTDLSLLRYEGFATQPAAARLRLKLEAECARELAAGVHLIVAQGVDGTLVVGDSHRYADAVDRDSTAEVEALILAELTALLDLPKPQVIERWVGSYPVANVKPVLAAQVGPRARLVTVTSGTGMSTGFAIGEETIAELFQ